MSCFSVKYQVVCQGLTVSSCACNISLCTVLVIEVTWHFFKYQRPLWHLTLNHCAYKVSLCPVSMIEVTWHVCQSNTRPSRHLQNCGSLQKTRFNWKHFTDKCCGTHSVEIRAYLLLKWKRQEPAHHCRVYKARWSPGLFWNNNKK